MGALRIIVADDHPIFRHGLSQLMKREAGLEVLGDASDGVQALELIQAKRPEIAVLDIDMPRMSGLEVARRTRLEQLEVKFIFLTGFKEEAIFNDAMDAGALGYVLKDSALTEIMGAIKSVSENRPYISAEISGYLLRRYDGSQKLRRTKPGLESLTPAERRILRLIADNKTSKEIADDLGVSPRTVENHRANICTKLDLRGIHSLVKFAFENKSKLAV